MTATKDYVSTTDTAKIMRKELKAAFPAAKFSVKCRSYSGGSSIDISWTDGPSRDAVDAVIGVFEGKGFDGMIDMAYTIDAWVLDGRVIGTRCSGTTGSRGVVAPWGMIAPHDDAELVHFSSGYVNTSRHVSATFARRLIAQIANYYNVRETVPEVRDGYKGAYEMVDSSDYYRAVSKGVSLEWRDAIHRASQDATLYARQD